MSSPRELYDIAATWLNAAIHQGNIEAIEAARTQFKEMKVQYWEACAEAAEVETDDVNALAEERGVWAVDILTAKRNKGG